MELNGLAHQLINGKTGFSTTTTTTTTNERYVVPDGGVSGINGEFKINLEKKIAEPNIKYEENIKMETESSMRKSVEGFLKNVKDFQLDVGSNKSRVSIRPIIPKLRGRYGRTDAQMKKFFLSHYVDIIDSIELIVDFQKKNPSTGRFSVVYNIDLTKSATKEEFKNAISAKINALNSNQMLRLVVDFFEDSKKI